MIKFHNQKTKQVNTDFKIFINVKFEIQNQKETKTLLVAEDFVMKNFTNNFEEQKYEN